MKYCTVSFSLFPSTISLALPPPHAILFLFFCFKGRERGEGEFRVLQQKHDYDNGVVFNENSLTDQLMESRVNGNISFTVPSFLAKNFSLCFRRVATVGWCVW